MGWVNFHKLRKNEPTHLLFVFKELCTGKKVRLSAIKVFALHTLEKNIIMKQLDVDVSPPANITCVGLTLTHATFGLDLSDL